MCFRYSMAVAALALAPGCASSKKVIAPPDPPPVEMPASHAEIHRRTKQVFQHALFCKPAAGGTPESLMSEPLFAIEDTPDRPAARLAPSLLYFEQTMAVVGARNLRQIAYYWPVGGVVPIAPLDGVRMTYREDGRPIVYERYRGTGDCAVLFVNAWHEREARKTLGEPLPGRRYAVERRLEEQPGVVVAGVVEDGPMVLGPWIYVAADGEVTTLICRCSPSQVENEAAGQYYDVHPVDQAWLSDPPGWRDPRRLEKLLRWP